MFIASIASFRTRQPDAELRLWAEHVRGGSLDARLAKEETPANRRDVIWLFGGAIN